MRDSKRKDDSDKMKQLISINTDQDKYANKQDIYLQYKHQHGFEIHSQRTQFYR